MCHWATCFWFGQVPKSDLQLDENDETSIQKTFGKKVGLFVSFKASSIRLPNKSGGPVLSCLFKVVTFSPFTNLEGPWAIWKSRWDKVTAECATLRSQQVMTTAMQSETKVWTQDLCWWYSGPAVFFKFWATRVRKETLRHVFHRWGHGARKSLNLWLGNAWCKSPDLFLAQTR